jgi:hypothetical protein
MTMGSLLSFERVHMLPMGTLMELLTKISWFWFL